MLIRPATSADHEAIWRILEPVIRAGETNALPRDYGPEAALAYWFNTGSDVFVAEADGAVLGTYFVRANHQGPASHVANAGYMTARHATGRGVARAMCQHSLAHARTLGFRAMQFNLVVATNDAAVHLWRSCGFDIVGRLPGSFLHPTRGYVDALVMYQVLEMPRS